MSAFDTSHLARLRHAGAAELFLAMDAILSSVKQIHVEAGPDLDLLARELKEAGGDRVSTLTPEVRDATVRICGAVIEQAFDASAFFLAIWSALKTGNAWLAGGARLLVSLNTWTSRRQKSVSPWRILDNTISAGQSQPSPPPGSGSGQKLGEFLSANPKALLILANVLAHNAVTAGFKGEPQATFMLT